ncbi:MAG: hypothetical protein WDZ41_02930 [Candidatus Babeliales bacterium]
MEFKKNLTLALVIIFTGTQLIAQNIQNFYISPSNPEPVDIRIVYYKPNNPLPRNIIKNNINPNDSVKLLVPFCITQIDVRFSADKGAQQWSRFWGLKTTKSLDNATHTFINLCGNNDFQIIWDPKNKVWHLKRLGITAYEEVANPQHPKGRRWN